MESITIDPIWLVIPGAMILGMLIAAFVRRTDSMNWDRDRRTGERRETERRTGRERRSDARLRHDHIHNPERRHSDRRDDERRDPGDWRQELHDVKSRVEEIQHDNRNA